MPAKLLLESRLPEPDLVYNLLIGLHRDLPPEESRKADAKLILLLANHVGDPEVIREAVDLVRGEARPMRGDRER